MVRILESKEDIEKFRKAIGDDKLANEFLSIRDKVKPPYNDLYYWIKIGDEAENMLRKWLDRKFYPNQVSKKDRVRLEKEGAKLVYIDEVWKVFHITTYEAAVRYGKHTKWCIAGSKVWNNGENGRDYFEQYTIEDGVNFYFYIRSDGVKYALALYPYGNRFEVFNQVDTDVKVVPNGPKVEGIPDEVIKETDKNGYIVDGRLVCGYCGVDKTLVLPNIEVIDNGAFAFNENIERVILPDGICAIYGSAFDGCTGLKKIDNISHGITYIGDCTFMNCANLTSLDLSSTRMDEVYENTFYDCRNLVSVRLPNTIEKIGFKSFCKCASLEEVNVPSSVKEIDSWAFFECQNLKHIYIPSTVEEIGNNAFRGCHNDLVIECDSEDSQAYIYATLEGIYTKVIQ